MESKKLEGDDIPPGGDTILTCDLIGNGVGSDKEGGVELSKGLLSLNRSLLEFFAPF